MNRYHTPPLNPITVLRRRGFGRFRNNFLALPISFHLFTCSRSEMLGRLPRPGWRQGTRYCLVPAHLGWKRGKGQSATFKRGWTGKVISVWFLCVFWLHQVCNSMFVYDLPGALLLQFVILKHSLF